MENDKCAELEKAYCARALIAPRWLPGTNSIFWYKRLLPGDKHQFTFVDCKNGICRAAFDHSVLATKLANEVGEQLDSEKLPLTWLNIDTQSAWVRFQYAEKTWQFSTDETLEEWLGEFDIGDVEIDHNLTKPTPANAKGKTDIILYNMTSTPLRYYWINHEGSSKQTVGSVRARESAQICSPLGYRFRFGEGSRAVAVELKRPTGIVNIEETPQGLAMRWEDNPLASIKHKVEKSDDEKVTPEYEAFIRKHNVWSRKDGEEKQVSFNGFEDDKFKTVYAAPCGVFAMAAQIRSGSQYAMELKTSIPPDQLRPKMVKGANNGPTGIHARAGDHMDTERPRLFNLAERCEVPTDDTLFRNPYYIRLVGWSDCGKKYRFLFNERGHKHVRLMEFGLDGRVKALVEDSSDTVVDYHQKLWYKILPATNDILWASERDGWNHLYRFSLEDGTLKNQITKGDWLVRSVEFVDTEAQKIWFKAFGMFKDQDPYQAHLACVDFDGSNQRSITSEDGSHLWRFGPDRRYIIDSWSRVDLLPHVGVIDAATGKQVVLLHQEELSEEHRGEYLFPEPFVAKGRDDKTDIYGVIVRPPGFDEKKKYPIIQIVYSHPFQFFTPKNFRNFSLVRESTQGGYVAVIVDGMGTNWRSKAFHDVAYKNMRDAGLPDHIKWMQAAARTRPWMDISRVGIQGGSAGGQNAAAAVLHHGDFYTAAVASSANHDNRLGNAQWEEMFMSWPVDRSYEDNSNCTHAGKLRGALMLTTGEVDDVVDPASTMQFADALIRADKEFELVVVPGNGHFDNAAWLDKKVARFFKRYLQDGDVTWNAEGKK